MSNTKQKAKELFDKYSEIQQCGIGNTEEELAEYIWDKAKKCALICVEEITKAVSAFGYGNCCFDDFETNMTTNTDYVDPCKYWDKVKSEIEKL